MSDDGAITLGDVVGFCTRCGRQLNRHCECINLFCQQHELVDEMLKLGLLPGTVAAALDAHEPRTVAAFTGEQLQQATRTGPLMARLVPPSTRAHVDPRVANPVRRRPFAMGTDAARRLVAWIVMGQAWSAWQRWGLVPEA